MAKRPFPRRGSVFLVCFDPARGHGIKKTKPAVVVSNNHLNELGSTVLVMPVTAGHYPYYHWIPLRPPEGGLSKPSSVVTDRIRSLDRRRLKKRIGAVSSETMTRIGQAIRDHFGLPEGGVLP